MGKVPSSGIAYPVDAIGERQDGPRQMSLLYTGNGKGREAMMRRGLLLFLGSGLLGLLTGCHCCQGRCDCQVYPLDHGTPSPLVKPASTMAPAPPIAPVPAQ